MRIAVRLLLVAGSLAVAWNVGKASRPGGAHRSTDSNRPARPARGARHGPFRGMAVQLHGGTGVYEAYHRLVPEVAGLGANTVMFVVHGWQAHAGSLDLHLDPLKTANADELGKLLDLAAVHGLRRILMPVVLLSQPRDGEWRGKVIPPGHDWEAWFRRYRRFIVHFAKLAERHKVEVLMIGSELIKSESKTALWRDTIAEVRQHYRGKLGYSANWDHYQTDKIGFWPELDYVGMTSYYELAEGPNPTIQEIDAAWTRIKAGIKAFQQEVRKPIIFTEVGWCSQEGAAHEGWNYYANQRATEAGQREQAILYQSFMKAWTKEPGVGGIIWWEWDTSPGGKTDYGYTPRGKLAETWLRLWFADKMTDGRADESNATSQASD